MLKLTYTPTSEITERDLVPGSRWRLNGSEHEYVLKRWVSSSDKIERFMLFCGDDAGEYESGYFVVSKAVMLAWLRRDFERVGEKHRCVISKQLLCVEEGALFIDGGKLYSSGHCDLENQEVICRGHGVGDIDKRLPMNLRVMAIVGPIEIDESVRGVG